MDVTREQVALALLPGQLARQESAQLGYSDESAMMRLAWDRSWGLAGAVIAHVVKRC